MFSIITNQRNRQTKIQWETTTPPPEWLKLKKLTTSTVGENMGQLELSCTADGNEIGATILGKCTGHVHISYDPTSPL